MLETNAPLQPPPTPSPWSAVLPQLQLAVDSTSLSAFKKCPRYHQLAIQKGYITFRENVHFTWGRIYHSALELYDRQLAAGRDFASAQREALRHALAATWDPDLKRPWTSDFPQKTRETLVRSIIWYTEKFKDDPVETIILANGKAAVEVSFRFDPQIATRTTGEHFLICGHLDKLGRFERKVWIIDRKSTKNQLNEEFFLQFNPHTQMSTYDMGGSFIFRDEPIEGIIIDAVQVGVGFSRFQRGFTHRTPDQRVEWLKETEYWLLQMEYLALKYGADDWPKNDASCFGCQFRGVCAENPRMRQNLLDTGFTKREWNPLVSREV